MKTGAMEFGCVDTSTGKYTPGYMDKGTMKFGHDLPWWKRMFVANKYIPLYEPPIYVGLFWVEEFIIRGHHVISQTPHAVYKEKHIFSGKFRYFISYEGRKVYINSDAYEKDGVVVTEKRFI